MAENGTPGDDWPAYSIEGSNGLNVLNGTSSATPGVVDYSACAFWDRVRATILQGSNGTSTANPSASSSGPAIATATGGGSKGPNGISVGAIAAAMLGLLVYSA